MLEISVQILLLFLFGMVLVRSTDMLLTSLQNLSRISHVSRFGITALIMAVATSLPELIVGILSALEGTPSLSLGNVIGANMSNIAMVVGGAAVVGGGIGIMGEYIKKDLIAGFFVGTLPLVLLLDGNLSRLDGVILLTVYAFFVRTVIFEKPVVLINESGEMNEPIYARFFSFVGRKAVRRHVSHLMFGLMLLIGSGYAMVQLSQTIAAFLQVPLLFVGLFLVSVGTTLPEISFAQRAIRKRQVSMILGNLLGTLAANSAFVLGIVAVIYPITPHAGVRPYLLGTAGYIILFTLFWFFSATKKRLSRWEGAVLILIYIAIMLLELGRA